MDPEEVKEKFKKFCEKLGGQISKERQFDYSEREWANVTACTLPEPRELLFMNRGGRVKLEGIIARRGLDYDAVVESFDVRDATFFFTAVTPERADVDWGEGRMAGVVVTKFDRLELRHFETSGFMRMVARLKKK